MENFDDTADKLLHIRTERLEERQQRMTPEMIKDLDGALAKRATTHTFREERKDAAAELVFSGIS